MHIHTNSIYIYIDAFSKLTMQLEAGFFAKLVIIATMITINVLFLGGSLTVNVT